MFVALSYRKQIVPLIQQTDDIFVMVQYLLFVPLLTLLCHSIHNTSFGRHIIRLIIIALPIGLESFIQEFMDWLTKRKLPNYCILPIFISAFNISYT